MNNLEDRVKLIYRALLPYFYSTGDRFKTTVADINEIRFKDIQLYKNYF